MKYAQQTQAALDKLDMSLAKLRAAATKKGYKLVKK